MMDQRLSPVLSQQMREAARKKSVAKTPPSGIDSTRTTPTCLSRGSYARDAMAKVSTKKSGRAALFDVSVQALRRRTAGGKPRPVRVEKLISLPIGESDRAPVAMLLVKR